jgi:spore cortex biosynthesis protein YabQ
VTLQVQFLTIGMMCFGGALLGILFDVLRVVGGQLRLPKWFLPLTDIFFWIVATIIVFRLLYYSNQGQVRTYIFLGLLIGICFHFAFLSPWVVKLVLGILQLLKMGYRMLKRMVEVIIIGPLIILYRTLLIIFGFLRALAIFLYKIMLQLCYPLWRLLQWIMRPVLRHARMPEWLTRIAGRIAHLFRKWF